MVRWAGNVALAVTTFVVAASNVAWPWVNDYVAVAIAVGAGFLARAAVAAVMARVAHHRMRKLYGNNWR